MQDYDTTGCIGSTIETFDGAMLDLLDPHPDAIDLASIAVALDRVPRFAGHTLRPYSVAAHSIFCHDLALTLHKDMDLAFAALMHDASEAYIGDMARPLKQFDEFYRRTEKKLQQVIAEKFGIDTERHAAAVKELDNIALRSEAKELLLSGGDNWSWGGSHIAIYPILPPCLGGHAHEFISRASRHLRHP